ncbi:MAG TPA: hypothetical protein VG477_01895 [Thermoanaerobaculia bacterium]|nr:hypothetical protein [Thermoanaerobaculia bacterium]
MERHAGLPQRLKESILGPKGETGPALRRAVEARAEELAGGPPADVTAIPEDLREYVDTVARHAHRITGEDIQTLRRAGYSEDTLFEVSAAAAVGAGMARLERGRAARKGGRR